MKYCENCGTQINEDALYCPSCGAKVGNVDEEPKTSSFALKEEDQSLLGTVIKIYTIVVTVLTGFALIPLLWTIPMTIHVSNTIKEKKEFSVVFIVLAFFFLARVDAILMVFYRRKFN